MIIDAIQQQIADVINHDASKHIEDEGNISIESLVENGVALLFLEKMTKEQECTKYGYLINRLKSFAKQLHIIHELQKQTFDLVFDTLTKHNITFIVLKGWALSYSVYEAPYLRPKTDIDILIDVADKDRTKQLLSELGYINPRGWEPEEIIDQYSMRKELVKNIYANIDVHLQLTNDKLIQPLLSWRELQLNSETQHSLSVQVLTKPYALLHALVHLLHHSCNGDDIKLVWFYDLYLLIKNLNSNEQIIFLKKIEASGLADSVRLALEVKQTLFPLNQTSNLLKALEKQPSDKKFLYLLHPPSRLNVLIRNFKQTKGLIKKIKVIREIFFPPKQEIYLKYGKDNSWPLPFLYCKRIVYGLLRLLSKTK